MKTIVQAALVSGVVGIAPLAFAPTASAQIGFSLYFGDVADAYRDGYWDHHHHWHRWQSEDDWRRYTERHHEHYHDYRHDEPGHEHDHDY